MCWVRSDQPGNLFVLDIDGDGNSDFDFYTCYCSAAGGYSFFGNAGLYNYVSAGPVISPALVGPSLSWVPYSYFIYADYNITYDPDSIEYFEDGGSWAGLVAQAIS